MLVANAFGEVLALLFGGGLLGAGGGRAGWVVPAPLAGSLTEPTIAIRPVVGPAPENRIVLAWKKSSASPSIQLLITAAAQASQQLASTLWSAVSDRAELA